MAAGGYDDVNERDLDWENLEGPVPMDLIDPDFSVPGAASAILPREESEALARETGVTPSGDAAGGQGPARPTDSDAGAGADAGHEPARTPLTGTDFPRPGSLPDPARGRAVPADGDSGTTQFGNTQDLEDEFARIRAEMEAEAEAEKLRKQEAEREEQAQRERLEQWMANARARLLKADADLTGPAGRVRIRKDSSPSLYRLAEMQRTMHMDGDATVPDGTRLAPAVPQLDPMATISVPADQFLGPDTASLRTQVMPAVTDPLPKRGNGAAAGEADPAEGQVPSAFAVRARKQAEQAEQAGQAEESAPVLSGQPVARAAAPEILSPEDGKASPADPLSHEGHAAHSVHSAHSGYGAPGSSETTLFRPMTREEALARKVAKLRQTAEEGENTLALAPAHGGDDESRALNLAIGAVVLVGILVVGLGLFAATQAGLFDGLENRIPFLKPKVTAAHAPLDPAPVEPAGPGSDGETAPASASGSGPDPVPAKPAARSSDARASAPAQGGPSSKAPPAAQPRTPSSAPRAGLDVPKTSRSPAGPVPAAPAKTAGAKGTSGRAATAPAAAKKAPAAAQARPAAAVDESNDDEIPAYARPRAKASNLADNILRNAVQTAANIDKFALREIYNRFALGYPGLSGEVKIGLTVDPGGRILEGSIVNSTTGVDAFDQELLRKVLEWRLSAFPETRPKFITVPFLFPMQGH